MLTILVPPACASLVLKASVPFVVVASLTRAYCVGKLDALNVFSGTKTRGACRHVVNVPLYVGSHPFPDASDAAQDR